MATIEKRTLDGKLSYRVKVRRKGYAPVTSTFDRLSDAKSWAQSIETKMDEGCQFNPHLAKKYTLKDAIDRYTKTVFSRKPKSQENQEAHLARWEEELGWRSLAEITPPLIAAVRDKLSMEKITNSKNSIRSPATVNRYMGTLSHLFTVAIKEWGWLHENPISKISKFKEPRGRTRFLADKERQTLLQFCQESQSKSLYTVAILCLATGARKMEILGLEKQEIDFQRKAIILEDTKNGERRVLHLSSEAWRLLKEAVAKSNPQSSLVFPSPNNPERPIDIQSAWETAVTKSKLADFKFHDLRHSTASYLAMNGATPSEIAEVLGHKTLDMVKRYAHLSESHTAKVVESMNQRIFGNPKTTAIIKNQKAKLKTKKRA